MKFIHKLFTEIRITYFSKSISVYIIMLSILYWSEQLHIKNEFGHTIIFILALILGLFVSRGFNRLIQRNTEYKFKTITSTREMPTLDNLSWEEIKTKVTELGLLPVGWDGWESNAPTQDTINLVLDFINILETKFNVKPSLISPTSDESILIGVCIDDVYSEWDLYQDKYVAVMFDDFTGTKIFKDGTLDFETQLRFKPSQADHRDQKII